MRYIIVSVIPALVVSAAICSVSIYFMLVAIRALNAVGG